MGTATDGGEGFKKRTRVSGERDNRCRPPLTAIHSGVMPPSRPPASADGEERLSPSATCHHCSLGAFAGSFVCQNALSEFHSLYSL